MNVQMEFLLITAFVTLCYTIGALCALRFLNRVKELSDFFKTELRNEMDFREALLRDICEITARYGEFDYNESEKILSFTSHAARMANVRQKNKH